jgi:YD repeat-containing protein
MPAAYVYSGTGIVSTISTSKVNRVESYVYDGAGRRIKTINGANEVTTYEYDARGNVIKEQPPIAGTGTVNTWDRYGRMKTSTDGNSKTQTWNRDAFGRLNSSVDLDGIRRSTPTTARINSSRRPIRTVRTCGSTTTPPGC